MKENIVFEIPSLGIKVPVLEGTDFKSLQVSSGHFEKTALLCHGNYCIAVHNSTIFAEIFNGLNQIQIGDEMYLIEPTRTPYEQSISAINRRFCYKK